MRKPVVFCTLLTSLRTQYLESNFCSAASYFVTAPFGVPVSVVTCAGAAVLLLLANRSRVIPIRKVLAGAPWQIVLFSLEGRERGFTQRRSG